MRRIILLTTAILVYTGCGIQIRLQSPQTSPSAGNEAARIRRHDRIGGCLYGRWQLLLRIGAAIDPEFTVAEVARLWPLDMGNPNSGEFGYIEQMPALFRQRTTTIIARTVLTS